MLPAARSPSTENVKQQLDFLSALNTHYYVLPLVSPAVKNALDFAVSYFTTEAETSEKSIPPSSSTGPITFLPSLLNRVADTLPTSESTLPGVTVKQNIQINRQTTPSKCILLASSEHIDRVSRNKRGRIGLAMFSLDPQQCINPIYNFAYSLGGSHGMSRKDKLGHMFHFWWMTTGKLVPCRESHST